MVVAWGDSRCGQTSIPPELTNAVSIAAGAAGFYSLALQPNGHLVAWTSSNSVASHLGSGPPFITTPLVNRSTVRGASVYFRAAASGSRPLNYQWQFNGTNLLAAQNSVLVLSNTQPTPSGLYTLIVSNAQGLASSSARLTVISQTARILSDSLTITNGRFHFNAIASPRGTLWIVQASTDLTEWADIYTLTSYDEPVTFTDPSTNFNRRFYRLRLEP